MGGLLEVADVARGDGNWTAGYQIDSMGCALRSDTTDVCNPVRAGLSGPAADALGDCTVNDASIFAVIVDLEGRAMRMAGSEPDVARAALDFESEKAAGKALWGEVGSQKAVVSLLGPDVSTVVAGASTNATVGTLLEEFWSRATGVAYKDTVIHLGVSRLLEMFGEIEGSVLKNLGIQVATSPGYPASGVAVTGPIRIKLSSDQVLSNIDSNDNTARSTANRLAALEFDPCTAVRVA